MTGRDQAGHGWLWQIGVGSLVIFLAATIWIGQGVASVFGQHEAYAEYWQVRAQKPGHVLYVALGDSAAQGIGATDPDLGYVGLLAERIQHQAGQTVRVVNLSVTGARVQDVLTDQLVRLDELGLGGQEPDVITLAIGGNDAGNTDPQRFRQTFDEVLTALPDGSYVADLPDFQGGPRLDASRKLSAVARDVIAAHPDLVAVELERDTFPNTLLDYAPDFFHPDNSGYVRWADAFWEPIREAL